MMGLTYFQSYSDEIPQKRSLWRDHRNETGIRVMIPGKSVQEDSPPKRLKGSPRSIDSADPFVELLSLFEEFPIVIYFVILDYLAVFVALSKRRRWVVVGGVYGVFGNFIRQRRTP
jgi:hypothetical protein